MKTAALLRRIVALTVVAFGLLLCQGCFSIGNGHGQYVPITAETSIAAMPDKTPVESYHVASATDKDGKTTKSSDAKEEDPRLLQYRLKSQEIRARRDVGVARELGHLPVKQRGILARLLLDDEDETDSRSSQGVAADTSNGGSNTVVQNGGQPAQGVRADTSNGGNNGVATNGKTRQTFVQPVETNRNVVASSGGQRRK